MLHSNAKVNIVGGREYSQKNWVGCLACFPKPLPNVRSKSAIFLTLLMIWSKI